MKSFDFHPEAREEYLEAIDYYAERSYQAGQEFLEQFEESVQSVIRFPESFEVIEDCVPLLRRYPLSGFPYSIIYSDSPDVVYIVAVAHQRRHPGYWKNRLTDFPE